MVMKPTKEMLNVGDDVGERGLLLPSLTPEHLKFSDKNVILLEYRQDLKTKQNI